MPHQMSPSTAAGRRRRRPGRGAQALLLGAFTALCLTGMSAAPALATTTPGSISGSVTVPTGTPSPGDVAAFLVNTNGDYVDSASVTPTGATTGTYGFSSVTPGQYYVYFVDFTPSDNVASDYYGDGGVDNITRASLITLASGGAVTLDNATLSVGGTISGSISDGNSATNTSASVYIDRVYSGADPDPLGSFKNIGVVGASSYSVSGLPAGTYRVEYDVAGHNATPTAYYYDVYVDGGGPTYSYDHGTDYAVSAGSTATANISVPAIGTVSGTVSGPSGPLAGDEVTLYDGFGDYVNGLTTASDGSYTMLVLPGTYKALFGGQQALNLALTWFGGATEAQAAPINVTPGGTTAGIDVTLGAGGAISGTVVAAQGGAPLGGIEVDVFDAQGNYVAYGYTQPDGSYTLADVPPGTWHVEFNGGMADNGSWYAPEFYGGTQSEFGSTPVTVSAGQTATVNGALLPAGTAALGMPKESAGALSGLHNNKVALRFKVAAGTGAGYLHSLNVALPKGFSWNAGALSKDLSLGAGVKFTDTVTNGRLVVTFATGQPSVAFTLKAGGIRVTKAIQKAAGGLTSTKKKKKGEKLALAAKAKKKAKPKDTIKSETINLSVSDTTGVNTSLSFTVKKPH